MKLFSLFLIIPFLFNDATTATGSGDQYGRSRFGAEDELPPLFQACKDGNLEDVVMMLSDPVFQRSNQINQRYGSLGNTIVHSIFNTYTPLISRDNQELRRNVLDAIVSNGGAHLLNAVNGSGQTPLMLAIEAHDLGGVQLLLEKGALPSEEDMVFCRNNTPQISTRSSEYLRRKATLFTQIQGLLQAAADNAALQQVPVLK